VSLILVIARPGTVTDGTRTDGNGTQSPAPEAGADLGWLAEGVESISDLSVAYTATPSEAVVAAEQALAEGCREVAVVPVATGANGARIPSRDVVSLGRLLRETRELHPDASVSLVGAPPGRPATFDEILAVLHPATSDDADLLAQAIGRAFDGDTDRFGRFVRTLQRGVPRGTQIAWRGSAVQGYAYKTNEPFDAAGPRTSDLDIVVLGDAAMAAFHPEAFVVPGVNTLPLSDRTIWVAPSLDPARSAAQSIARRPVAIQAMARWFLDLRSGLQDQPYVLLDA
jgi:hypothetical protein